MAREIKDPSPDDRIRFALAQCFDSGNALADAIEGMDDSEDGYEFELALMGVPETIDGVLKDMDYYVDKMRRIYVEKAVEELEFQEVRYKGARSMS